MGPWMTKGVHSMNNNFDNTHVHVVFRRFAQKANQYSGRAINMQNNRIT